MKRIGNMSTELSSFVQAQVGSDVAIGIGDVYFAVPTASSTAQWKSMLQSNGVTESHYGGNIANIHTAMSAGRNDTMIVFPGSYSDTATVTWSKDYTNLIGACSPIQVNARSRISTSGAAVSPLVTWSADGCVVKNIMFDHQGSNATTAPKVMTLTGDRNYFEKVTLRHIGAASVPGTGMRNLYTTSSNGENHWFKSTIGADSVDGDSGDPGCIEYAGTGTARDIYEDCVFLGAGAASGFFLKAGTNATTSFTLLKRCTFFNNELGSMDSMTQGFIIGSGNGYFLLQHCGIAGVTALETSDSGLLLAIGAQATSTQEKFGAATGW